MTSREIAEKYIPSAGGNFGDAWRIAKVDALAADIEAAIAEAVKAAKRDCIEWVNVHVRDSNESEFKRLAVDLAILCANTRDMEKIDNAASELLALAEAVNTPVPAAKDIHNRYSDD